jgi:ribosomal protein L40E
MFEESEEQMKTVRRSIDAVQELKRRGAIVEITFCKRCGTENNINNVQYRRCGAKLSKTPMAISTKKKPWWRFW